MELFELKYTQTSTALWLHAHGNACIPYYCSTSTSYIHTLYILIYLYVTVCIYILFLFLPCVEISLKYEEKLLTMLINNVVFKPLNTLLYHLVA